MEGTYLFRLPADHEKNVQGTAVIAPDGSTVENVTSIDLYFRISTGLTARVETTTYGSPWPIPIISVINVPARVEVLP